MKMQFLGYMEMLTLCLLGHGVQLPRKFTLIEQRVKQESATNGSLEEKNQVRGLVGVLE